MADNTNNDMDSSDNEFVEGCAVCSDKQRGENVKKAVELIRGAKIEDLLDYSTKNGYINGAFIQGGREFSFYINSLNGNYEYNLSSRQSPFSLGSGGSVLGSSVSNGSLYSLPESEEGNMYDRADGLHFDNNDIDSILYGLRSDDGEIDPEDLEDPRNRARVLTEIIESEYGQGGVDKIIEYGMKDENNIVGQFEANGQEFDFKIDLDKNQITYSPILTAQQKASLAKNKDSVDRFALGENIAKAEVMGLRIDGKDATELDPHFVTGYLMEMEPAPFF